MANWRETGYVPASDDDLSDAELSTQEDPNQDEEVPEPTRGSIGIDGLNRASEVEMGREGEEEEEGGEPVALVPCGVDAVMNDAANGEYLSIESMAIPSSGIARVGKELSGIGLKSSQHGEPDLPLEPGMGGEDDVPVVDLSNLMGDSPCSEVDIVTSDDGDKGNDDLGSLPDLIAINEGGNLGNQRVVPSTPPPQTSQTFDLAAGNTPATSTPLSSPPSTVVTPPLRPAALPTFEIVIPSAYGEDQLPRYARSLRARKPIQKNPYLIEQERYRQTLKARGVRPVRITEVEEETNGGLDADDDSQEHEYVALPEPENDESQFLPGPSRRHVALVDIYDLEDFPDGAGSSRDRPQPNGALPNGVKRRKVAHANLERSTVARAHPNRVHRAENARPSSATVQAELNHEIDIYDLPGDALLRSSRPPLAQTYPNRPTSNEGVPQSQAPGEKRRGILAVLDSSSDAEPESSRRERPRLTPPRSREATPHSPSIVAVSSSSEGQSAESVSEDESQEVRRLQRKTAGVLPASWWKLDKRRPSSTNDSHRNRRRSPTPSQEPTSRPGIARARISSRPRSPIGDTFLFDGDSDGSSGPTAIEPPAPRSRAGSVIHWPEIEVVDLDDVIEDDRIDRMLPSAPRKSNTSKRRHGDRNHSSRGSHGVSGGQGTGLKSSGHRSSRLRQPRITSHVSSKRKPTKPRPNAPALGIVDATRHHKATNPDIPPPAFLKVAARSARERKSKGRHRPTRKVFRLETAADTQQVQDVLRDWREGTIAFRAHDSSDEDRWKRHRQTRIPSPQGLGGLRVGYSDLGLGSRSERAHDPKRVRVQQTTLTNIVRTQPLLRKINERPRPTGQKLGITTVPGRRNAITHRPYFMPEPAQFELETPASITAARQRKTPWQAQQHGLAKLLRQTARRNPNLRRFMEDEDLINPRLRPPLAERCAPTPTLTPAAPAPLAQIARIPRARRKRTPIRIDADTIERRQPPPEDRVIIDDDIRPLPEPRVHDKPVLEGLLPFGSKYTLTFDTVALKPGTIFRSETFIGSGGLSRALNPQHSMLGQSIGFIFGGKSLHWGLYEDSVAAEFESIMEKIADLAENSQEGEREIVSDAWASRTYSFYAFFSKYLSQVVSFSDPIDLISFGQRVLQAIDVCCDRVSSVFGANARPDLKGSQTRLVLQVHVFSLVFAFQIYKLASGDVESQQRLELEKYIKKLGHQLFGRLLRCGFDDVRACYEDQRQNSKYERGIDSGHCLVEAWVVAIHILDQIPFQGVGFWQLLNHEFRLADLERMLDIRIFERHWRIIFTILPLYQFDEFGAVQGPVRDGNLSENWAPLRVLVGRPLKVYSSNITEHFGTINNYCRVLYTRCHHLITRWGWLNAELIIPTLYEFFANKSLANLKNEEAVGSPDFLQHLEKSPSLQVFDSDSCFHLLLKIVSLGLHGMKSSAPISRIRNIVNRLMPNHGRQYPKEEELRLESLVALRNHHDLLATLWWAATPQCRPPLEAIRYLVDPNMSHQQACVVSIRTWSNLIRFQLHSGEDLEELKPFMGWFDELVISTLNQHHGARIEAEKQFKAAKEKGDTDLSEDLVEDNIRRNQRQLEGTLIDAVKSLKTAMAGIGGQTYSAIAILTKASTANILNSYNRLSHKLLVEVLELIQQYLVVCKDIGNSPAIAVQASEDSQDYGDWSGFDDIVVGQEQKAAAEHLKIIVYDALHRMLSNCFGADRQPEESLLVKVVDTWALVIRFLVHHGLKNWDTYLDRYNSESWSSLRDTEQTRKYTAYFIPKVIRSGTGIYESNKTAFISYWLKTLVERESLLKFQNEYTASLLNSDAGNPLFVNPPFARDEASGEFKISLLDFRSRRLSLLSTVLANMREFYEETLNSSPSEAAALKREYSEMLKTMMKSMKEIYQELQAKSTPGAYVQFVQQVVEYLQQHSVDIVVIDRFFTDSAAFPLPSTDPTYVVGRLKSYGLKLSYPRAHKQLISFFQSVCERAAIDREQEYLVHQLTASLSDDFENGDPEKPTLRALFLEAIIPAYIQCSLSNPAGWIMAVPILQASEMVVRKLRTGIDSTLFNSVQSVLSMLTSLLDGIRVAISSLHAPSEVLTSLKRLAIFTLMLPVITRVIPIIDWLSSTTSDAITDLSQHAFECTAFLVKSAAYLSNIIKHREAEMPIDVHIGQRYQGTHRGAKEHCLAVLQRALDREWVSHAGAWHVVRGANRREVVPPAFPPEAQLQRDLMRKTIALVRVAARTEIFAGVARALDPGIWEEENLARGRRARARLGSVFC